MGIFDDMTVLLGRGMDAADKKTQVLRLQAEMGHIGTRKEKALAELGRAVLMQVGGNPAFVEMFSDQIKGIEELETQEGALRQRIEALQNGSVLSETKNTASQAYACPVCGSSVTLDTMFCPNCGDNLTSLKAQFRKCPSCGVYYPKDAMFCERCGSRTEDLAVAQTLHSQVVEDTHVDSEASPSANESIEESTEMGATQTNVLTCQKCGAPVEPNASFCGECGNPL